MRFWDTSALVPLIVDEPVTDILGPLFREDPQFSLWWGTLTECHAAIARKHREGVLTEQQRNKARRDVAELWDRAFEVEPHHSLRLRSVNLVSLYTLRSADAFQLAAWHEVRQMTGSLDFVCLDHRLRDAAAAEGALLLPSNLEPGVP